MSRFPTVARRGNRLPPVVAAPYTIALISDIHLSTPPYFEQHRAYKARDDWNLIAARTQIDAWIVAGDFATNALPAEVTMAQAWLNSINRGTAPYAIVPGNHDIIGEAPTGGADLTTPAQWATMYSAFGVTGQNYVVDLGADLRIVCLFPTSMTTGTAASYRLAIDAATLTWCDARLSETTRRCIMVFHAPLQNTVGTNPVAALPSNSQTWYASSQESYTIEQMLVKHPNIIAWVSGHTHTPPATPDIAIPVTYGPTRLAAISASSPFVLLRGNPPEVCSALLSIYPDHIDVRYRDHGAGQWISPVRTVTL